MKNKLLCSAALLLATLPGVIAAPLTVTTAVHTKPDPASPAITFLKAGADPKPATSSMSSTPAGWMAVELPGPFEGYVENKDLSKSLDVKPGSAIRVGPKLDAAILATAEKGDKASITGLRGKWTQVSLEKNLVGYIKVGGASGVPTSSAASSSPAATRSSSVMANPSSAPTTLPPAQAQSTLPPATGVGQAVPMVNQGNDAAATLPRQFAGRFVSTRKAFTPRRPYDYALADDAGRRYAYLDVSKLLLTEQIEKYIDHSVVVFGGAKTVPDSKDIVITVETLQLNK